jgi:hypothetical protein
MNELYDNLHEMMSDEIEQKIYQRNNILNNWVINLISKNCVPPIKGTITKEKIKWRGIYIVYQESVGTYFSQRGRRISPILGDDLSITD